MRFSKIGVNTKQVALTRQDKDSKTGAVEEIALTSPERPMTSFSDAVQAFKAYVLGLLPFKVPESRIVITTLTLSESKDGRRGLQVSCNVPIPKCDDKVISLTTPLVHEPGEESTGESFALSDDVLTLIALAEAEATKYADGDRMQLALALDASEKPSENTKAFDQRAAAAEVGSTRTPKKGAKQHAASNGTNGKRPTAKKPSRAKTPGIPRVPDYEIVDDAPPPKVTDEGAQAVRDAVEAGVQ
jgi:hypothetical protein